MSKVEIKKLSSQKRLKKRLQKRGEKENAEEWITVKTLEAGQINGKQIDKELYWMLKQRYQKLIESKKAEKVAEKKRKNQSRKILQKKVKKKLIVIIMKKGQRGINWRFKSR